MVEYMGDGDTRPYCARCNWAVGDPDPVCPDPLCGATNGNHAVACITHETFAPMSKSQVRRIAVLEEWPEANTVAALEALDAKHAAEACEGFVSDHGYGSGDCVRCCRPRSEHPDRESEPRASDPECPWCQALVRERDELREIARVMTESRESLYQQTKRDEALIHRLCDEKAELRNLVAMYEGRTQS